MRLFLSFLSAIFLSACGTRSHQSTGGKNPIPQSVEPYSIVTIRGKIDCVPEDSLWPHYIKKGTPYRFTIVLDNSAADSQSHRTDFGSYTMEGELTRYDLRIGKLHLSNLQRSPSKFVVLVFDNERFNRDAYHLGASYHQSNIPELPNLATVHPLLRIYAKGTENIISDDLPWRTIPVSELTNQLDYQHVMVAAHEKGNSNNKQWIGGNATKFTARSVSEKEARWYWKSVRRKRPFPANRTSGSLSHFRFNEPARQAGYLPPL